MEFHDRFGESPTRKHRIEAYLKPKVKGIIDEEHQRDRRNYN